MRPDKVQRPIDAAVSGSILDEVVGPDLVWPFRSETHARVIIQPKPPSFLLLLRDFQPFTPPDALNPLVVHMPARVVQQTGDHAISIAPVLVGHLDDIIGQPFFICPALRHLALFGSVLSERAAGAAFRYAKLPPHMVDKLATT